MSPAAVLAALILTGPVTHTDYASVAPTKDGQLTYASAVECRRGAGWLMKTAPDGRNLRKHAFYVLHTDGGDTAGGAAGLLCRPFTNPGATQ